MTGTWKVERRTLRVEDAEALAREHDLTVLARRPEPAVGARRVAFAIHLNPASPFRRDYPWAALATTTEAIHAVVIEGWTSDQLLLPWPAA